MAEKNSKTDLNVLAQAITEQEGLKKSLSIAQVKEVLKLTLRHLKGMTVEEVASLLKRVK